MFDYPLKDWILAITLLSGIGGGVFAIGGAQSVTTAAIETQTKAVVSDLNDIQDALRISRNMATSNAARIDALEMRMDMGFDTLNQTILNTAKNLEGFHRGQIDILTRMIQWKQENPEN